MNKIFTFHADPGHAWLSVSTDMIGRLGLNLTDFSRLSYIGRPDPLHCSVYLEEDCDAGIFLDAYKAKHGLDDDDFEFTEIMDNEESWIRSLPMNEFGWTDNPARKGA